MWVLKILEAVLIADFVSGLGHWIEDSYFSTDTPLLGPTIAKHLLHHQQPHVFVAKPWTVTIRSSLFWASMIALVLFPLGLLGTTWIMGLCALVFANQIHKWAHMSPMAVPRVVHWLQLRRLLLTSSQHRRHHTGSRDSCYCVVTNGLNPILDSIGFWRGMEFLVHVFFGATRRLDTSPLSR